MPKKIAIVLGTARKGRMSEYVAREILSISEKRDEEITFVDVKDFATERTIPPWEDNEMQKKWVDVVNNTDAFIFVVPEYNHSYPGELKILLDKAHKEYNNKLAAICGVSSGGFGGVRMIEHFTSLAHNFGMYLIKPNVMVANVNDMFRSDGKVKNKDMVQKLHEDSGNMIDALLLLLKK